LLGVDSQIGVFVIHCARAVKVVAVQSEEELLLQEEIMVLLGETGDCQKFMLLIFASTERLD
jgi:hypothetical protein